MIRLLSAVPALLVMASLAVPAMAVERRIAFVIGNGAYKAVPALPNAVGDATLIAGTLRGRGFEVIERTDTTQREMKKAIKAFGDLLGEAGADGVGLFYYAGHGVQAGGINYLVPLAAEIADESDLDIEAVSANAVLGKMEYAGSTLNFVILDACRNNPYASGFRSVGRGLARMLAPRGSLVSYATEPGGVAADGTGANSPYTTALAEAMTGSGPARRTDVQAGAARCAGGDGQRPDHLGELVADGRFLFRAASGDRSGGSPAHTPAGTIDTVLGHR
jgi:uncharacterized caspase-like protein